MSSKKGDFFTSIFESVSKELGNAGKSLNEMLAPDDIGTKVPAINIIDLNDRIEVQVAAPGMEKTNFSINVEDDVLVISSKGQEESDKMNFVQREFGFGPFKRSFEVPKEVNIGGIGAAYEKGLLKVTLPKKEEFIKESKSDIEIW